MLFFGVLKDIVGRSEETVEVAPGSTIRSLFQSYVERFATLRDKRSSIVFARNREFSPADTVLADGDEVAFLPPVSGGTNRVIRDSAGNLFVITRQPIESRRLVAALQRPEDGAVVVFEGVVRNNTRGRQTTHLEYECYEEMAIEQMARIGKKITAQGDISRLGMVHRLGLLQIGEASVSVVATAPHRKPAFDAALEGINRLKREVPIWKKEFFADGAVWVDGEWSGELLQSIADQ